MARAKFIHTSHTDVWNQAIGGMVTHVISTDDRGRRWERWDGLGESNADVLMTAPEEPEPTTRDEPVRAKRKQRNAR